MGNRLKGTVKWFNTVRGYGFITDEDGVDYFVHFSQIRMDGFKKLRADQKVEFELGADEKNRSVAVDVVIIEE